MFRFAFRIILLLSIFLIITGGSNWAVGNVSPEGKKFLVTFGGSYHNYLPETTMRMDVIFKSDATDSLKVSQELVVLDSSGVKIWKTVINLELGPGGNMTVPLLVPVPKVMGTFKLTLANNLENKGENVPSFEFNVVQPKKSTRLSKLLVFAPDEEVELVKFLKTWGIKAPEVSWGQVLLFGKKGWTRFAAGDQEVTQMVDRALKREMSVIFLDFSIGDENKLTSILLPYGVSVSFIKAKGPEQSFVLKSDYKELTYDFTTNLMKFWNGYFGVVVPATDLRFEGKGVNINAYASAGENPYRFPLVELIPKSGKGKIYLSQIITDGRLDESVKAPRNKPGLPAYDPMAAQFLLNLISASVGDNLLK
jgi:hypothetical protein